MADDAAFIQAVQEGFAESMLEHGIESADGEAEDPSEKIPKDVLFRDASDVEEPDPELASDVDGGLALLTDLLKWTQNAEEEALGEALLGPKEKGQTISHDGLRKKLMLLAAERGDWAGLPMPIKGLRLRVEDNYRYQGLQDFQLDEDNEPLDERDAINLGIVKLLSLLKRFGVNDDPKGAAKRLMDRLMEDNATVSIRNEFYSHAAKANVVIYEVAGVAMMEKAPDRITERADKIIAEMMATEAWDLRAEVRALIKLRREIKPHLWAAYLMTGQFLETSPRSGITYIFRRMRPTIALSKNNAGRTFRILACLCLHPIGYYQGTGAGVMVPTDDVLAHLLLMRGCEHKFWSRSEQHQPWELASGLSY